MLGEPWRIGLFGRLQASQGQRVITRFRTQKTGTLLAYLAYFQRRTHPREQLIELLWPEREVNAGRTSLRTALASLRRQLEPPGIPVGSVLITDRTNVQLNPAAVITDVADFEAALRTAAPTADPTERAKILLQAAELYRGELLPGFYDDWITPERERWAKAFLGTLSQLTSTLEQMGDLNQAIDYARRAVSVDPLREEAHGELMRLYAAAGQPSDALRQYQELERILHDELNVTPSEDIRAFAVQLRTTANSSAAVRNAGHLPASLPIATSLKSMSSAAISSLSARPSRPIPRLPLPLTRFFGRKGEIERLKAMLSSRETRLVTLTGLGGSGKTRLAIEVAEQLREVFDESIYFVGLADLTDARLISTEIVAALRLPSGQNFEPIEQVAEVLGQQSSLLILDNFEQLITDGALIVSSLLARVPTLTCLATSRHPLNITGEREFPVMPLPTPLARITPEQLMSG